MLVLKSSAIAMVNHCQLDDGGAWPSIDELPDIDWSELGELMGDVDQCQSTSSSQPQLCSSARAVIKRRTTSALERQASRQDSTEHRAEANRRYSLRSYHRTKLRREALRAEVKRLEAELALLTKPASLSIPGGRCSSLDRLIALKQEACTLRRENAVLLGMQKTNEEQLEEVVICV